MQLEIRNLPHGAIYQIYHGTPEELTLLVTNARANGFLGSTIQKEEDKDETFPNWRNEEGGPDIVAKARTMPKVKTFSLVLRVSQGRIKDEMTIPIPA